jgi:hypothetical protein
VVGEERRVLARDGDERRSAMRTGDDPELVRAGGVAGARLKP